MKKRYAAGLLLGALLSAGAFAAATLPAPLRDQKPELLPVGAATLRWFGLHVYDVALFAQERPYADSGTAALSIRYHISIKHHRLLETTLKEWRRMGKGEAVQRDRWIKQLASLWPDLKKGDSLTAFMRQDGTTQFYFGDRLLGEVPDPAFGPAFFSIWLDVKCSHPGIRNRLLGVAPGARQGSPE
jgi:hypothetical protein